MSGDGHILVTFGAVNEAAMDTDGVASQIDAQLSDLKAYLAPLVGSWSGEASERDGDSATIHYPRRIVYARAQLSCVEQP